MLILLLLMSLWLLHKLLLLVIKMMELILLLVVLHPKAWSLLNSTALLQLVLMRILLGTILLSINIQGGTNAHNPTINHPRFLIHVETFLLLWLAIPGYKDFDSCEGRSSSWGWCH